VATAQIKIEAQVQQALNGIEQVNRSLGGLQSTLDRSSRAMDSVQRSTDLAATAMRTLVAAISIREIVNLADAATLVNNKLSSVTETTAQSQAAFQEVARIAQLTGQRFEAVGDLYQKIALQSQNLGLSQKEVARITENFSKALVLTGTTGQAAASAIYQFGQALGRGKVAYEDIRQLQEASSATVALIAKQFGMSGQEFVSAVQNGKISAEQFALAVNNLGTDVNDKFNGMNKTVGQALENIRTNFILLLDRFEKSTGIFSGTAKLLDTVAKNMDAVVVAGAAFISVYAIQKIMAVASAIRAVGIASAFASGGLTLITGGIAALLAYGGFKLFEDDEGKKINDAAAAAEQAGNVVRGVNDARKRSETEINKEQMAGLEAYFRKLDAQKLAAGLSGQELAIQKAISAAAQELKVTENELTTAVKNRITARAIETYNQEQSKKNAELIAKSENQRNETLRQATMSLDDQLAIGKMSVEQQEIERHIRQVNRSLIKEIRNEAGVLLGYTKGLSEEEEKIQRAKLQQIQADRLAISLAQQKALLAGQAMPQTREQQIQTATAAIGRLDPRLAAEQQYQTEKAALAAMEYENEKQKYDALSALDREYARKKNDLTISMFEQQLKASGVVNTEIINVAKTTMAQAQMVTQGGIVGIQGALGMLGGFLEQAGKNNKKAFEAQKAVAIAQTIISTYQAATQAFAAMSLIPFVGPALGFAAAATIVAAGLANVAAIRSQQYQGRQLGGPVMGGQSYLVGENGPEIFTPNTTGSITRNSDLGGGSPVNVNFTIIANDTQGFDQLLTSRQGVIKQIISDAMLERGSRSIV
jgi:tape measure domain-containing protein